MNVFIVSGRLVRDPEIRFTKDSKKIVNFSVAVDREYKRDETDYFNCTAFGKTAEFIEQYVSKGTKVLINGSVNIDKYEDKYYTKVIVNRIEPEFKPKSDEAKPSIPVPKNDMDDDVPF